jgi:hypothetical protein
MLFRTEIFYNILMESGIMSRINSNENVFKQNMQKMLHRTYVRNVGLKGSTAVNIKLSMSWNVMPYNLVECCKRFFRNRTRVSCFRTFVTLLYH